MCIRDSLSSDELLELSKKQKLSLSREDMEVVQQIFREIDRDPVSYTHLDVYKRQPLQLQ